MSALGYVQIQLVLETGVMYVDGRHQKPASTLQEAEGKLTGGSPVNTQTKDCGYVVNCPIR